MPPKLFHVVEQMLSAEPLERPSALEALASLNEA
jgi:hypothetical protein